MKLIVTADDLGASAEINEAIFRCMEEGVVTRSSIIANGKAVDALASIQRGIYSFGLHFNLTDGQASCPNDVPGVYLGSDLAYKKSSLTYFNTKARLALECEFKAQLDMLRDKGISIQYADSHHHVHTDIGVVASFTKSCLEAGINQTRPARTDRAKTPLHLAWKKKVNRKFRSGGLRIADQLFDLDHFDREAVLRSGIGSAELMLHPTMLNGMAIDVTRPGVDLISLLKTELRDFELCSSL